MTTKNDITGDAIQTKVPTEKYRTNYDAIDWTKEEDEAFNALTPKHDPVACLDACHDYGCVRSGVCGKK